MKCLKAQAPDSLFLLLQKATKQQHSERSRSQDVILLKNINLARKILSREIWHEPNCICPSHPRISTGKAIERKNCHVHGMC
jgi:hypothetical protein